MSYNTVNKCANDGQFVARVNACIAQEQRAQGITVAPSSLLETMRWAVASAGDVETAYAYALDIEHINPGGDESVITDGMILANVQAAWPA